MSAIVRDVGGNSQNALAHTHKVRGELGRIAGLVGQFHEQWTEGSKEEELDSHLRSQAAATLLQLQRVVHNLSTTLGEAAVCVHNAEAGRRRVAAAVRDAKSIKGIQHSA